MFIVTGAAGFIGSCLVKKLNNSGLKDVVLVDDFSRHEKANNLLHKSFLEKVERENFFDWFVEHAQSIDFVLHIGARTDTTEFDKKVFDHLNLNYSKKVWELCTRYGVPLIYASSAATYGMGELGYVDDHEIIDHLKPLNPYGESKNEFDKWVLGQKEQPPYWAGLKFFNVYGPNEYHKGRMASVVFHSFNQIKAKGNVKLFRSHRPDFEDGKQLRDFIYVKDVTEVIWYLMNYQKSSAIFNLGTGKARPFLDLAIATFKAAGKDTAIEFIDTPSDIRDKYQYFTEASMEKLRLAGYSKEFYSLEEGISEYVSDYLIGTKYL